MHIQQIRNATIRIDYAGKRFLVDPWFQKKGTGGCAPSPDPERAKRPSPMVELPCSVEEIMDGVDAMIVTHVHPDHFEPETAAMLDRALPVLADGAACAQIKDFGYAAVTPLSDAGVDFGGVTLRPTGAMHGETPERAMGPVCGVVLSAPGEPVLYIAGDTVYYDGVEQALARHRPDVIVVNACGAEIMGVGRLIMDAEDVVKVCQAAPEAVIIASHMEAVNHASVDRAGLRAYLDAHGCAGRVLIPADGETLSFA